MSAGSGLAIGQRACPELAAEAVGIALQAAGWQHAATVLLFLTPEFAHSVEPALRAAARAAGTTQVWGCTGFGIFTEQDWVVDAPAAAVLLLDSAWTLRPATQLAGDALRLTLAAPNAINTTWLDAAMPRLGGVAGDATGTGPFKVWTHGRVIEEGRVDVGLSGGTLAWVVSQGLQVISPILTVDAVRGFEVCRLNGQPALPQLLAGLPADMGGVPPLYTVMAGLPWPGATDADAYHVSPVIALDRRAGSVTLSSRLQPGDRLFWGLRQPEAAAAQMHRQMAQLRAARQPSPDFLLVFSCMGRGPYFYGGRDEDWLALRAAFPGVPLLGFYGNGEIAPDGLGSRLLQYALVAVAGYGDRGV